MSAGSGDLPASSEVVVVGGGVMGTSVAYALASRGVETTVLERDGIAVGASGRNAGIVFAASYETTGLAPYLAASLRMLRRWPAELEADFAFRQSGALLLATDAEAPRRLRRQEEATGGPEVRAQVLDGDAARRLVPALSGSITGAVYYPDHGHLWPFALNQALAVAAARRGARIVAGAEVTGMRMARGRVVAVETRGGRIACRWVVNAANAWAAPVARMAGLAMPVQPRRGQALATLAAAPLVPLALDYPTGASPLYWRQTPAGQVVMGGGRSFDRAGEGSYDRGNTPEVVRFFASGIAALMPAVRGLTVARMWAGTMGFTPDARPIVGPSSLVDGFVMAQACNGSGLPWVPLVGSLVAEAITGAPPSLPLALLSPDRFVAPSPPGPLSRGQGEGAGGEGNRPMDRGGIGGMGGAGAGERP